MDILKLKPREEANRKTEASLILVDIKTPNITSALSIIGGVLGITDSNVYTNFYNQYTYKGKVEIYSGSLKKCKDYKEKLRFERVMCDIITK